MQRWQVLTSLCLLALWLPALNHCRLEQIPGLDFLACCAHENTAPHEDDDCETDGCARVENGFFKLEDAPEGPAAPDLSTALLLPCPAPGVRRLPASATFATSPLTRGRPWQCVFRVVGSPRAPSSPPA